MFLPQLNFHDISEMSSLSNRVSPGAISRAQCSVYAPSRPIMVQRKDAKMRHLSREYQPHREMQFPINRSRSRRRVTLKPFRVLGRSIALLVHLEFLALCGKIACAKIMVARAQNEEQSSIKCERNLNKLAPWSVSIFSSG